MTGESGFQDNPNLEYPKFMRPSFKIGSYSRSESIFFSQPYEVKSKRQSLSSCKTPIQGVKRQGYPEEREDDRIKNNEVKTPGHKL